MKTTNIRIPKDRIGVVIGDKGSTKKRIEKRTGCTMDIDSNTGEIEVDTSKIEDPLIELKVLDVIKAIGRGFSPVKALKILNDDYYFEIIDIKSYVGRSSKAVKRMKGRVIGREGRTRQLIEELSESFIAVYGHTVCIIGPPTEMAVARKAVQMILEGSEHGAVYSYLESKRPEIKRDKLGFF